MRTSFWSRLGGALVWAAVGTVALAEDPKTGGATPAPAVQPPAADAATTGPAPKMEIDATDFDFGTVWQGEPAERNFTIKNTGVGDLTLSVKSSCGCTVPTKPQSPLKPGEQTSFSVSYNTKKRKGAANQTITVTSNDPDRKVTQIRVHGEVKELIKMDPPDGIFFGQLYENSKVSKSMKLEPQADQPMKLKLKAGQDFGMYSLELKEVTAGKEYELVALTNPPLEVNSPSSRKEVILETGLDKLPEITVAIQSVVAPPVQVRPTKLYVPKTLSGKLTRNIRVTYLPEQPLKILEAKCDVPGISAAIAPENPNPPAGGVAYREVIVTIEPDAKLPENEPMVVIKTDSKDARFAEIKVPVKVVASAPMPGSQPAMGVPGGEPSSVQEHKQNQERQQQLNPGQSPK